MLTAIKTLLSSTASNLAQARIAELNNQWAEHGAMFAAAKIDKVIHTNRPEWTTYTARRDALRVSDDGIHVEVVTGIRAHDRAPDWMLVKRHRKIEFGRGELTRLCTGYRSVLNRIELTHQVVCTPAQQSVLKTWIDGGVQIRLLFSARRTDNGATALVFRIDDDVYATLFEDGTITTQRHVYALQGTWFYNQRVKRTATPVKPQVKAKVSASAFTIQRR